ncbi:hypothetical protein PACTADRAFT_50818 [Pachysolen tannophilus NRRL Y-2460]|uniref:GID complex catalytic subunit 2 n=1 Tax=Pachysolen tannophilus NRRL Y-2460 TaxID=669874 RepID=A0A1E4TT98_PACTA|nr:hypothetical protein PACTADRAFT_50818 [Pachysolen tannophilus NRRL Y-2460]
MSSDLYASLKEDVQKLSSNKSLDECFVESAKLLNVLKKAEKELSNDQDDIFKSLPKYINNWNDEVTKKEKSINHSIRRYNKTMDKFDSFDIDEIYKYKIPIEDNQKNKKLIDRAIIMHLLRNGNFTVAQTLQEQTGLMVPKELIDKFKELYDILNSLINESNLDKAIDWCNKNKLELNEVGSDLGFNLHKLKFIKLYQNEEDPFKAYNYAKENFPNYGHSHLDTISKLVSDIMIHNESSSVDFYNDSILKISQQLSRVFCSLLGLSSESPLYSTLLASFFALPNFIKFNNVSKKTKRLDWTTKNELAFEVLLPNFLQYHSVFICPVSKEETTIDNPPLVLPCKHILSKESVMKLSRRNSNSTFKCPYCPSITRYSETKMVKFVNI